MRIGLVLSNDWELPGDESGVLASDGQPEVERGGPGRLADPAIAEFHAEWLHRDLADQNVGEGPRLGGELHANVARARRAQEEIVSPLAVGTDWDLLAGGLLRLAAAQFERDTDVQVRPGQIVNRRRRPRYVPFDEGEGAEEDGQPPLALVASHAGACRSSDRAGSGAARPPRGRAGEAAGGGGGHLCPVTTNC